MSTSATDVDVEVNFSPLHPPYTLDKFWQLPEPGDRAHYELIGGHLFMVPPPDPPHGSIDARLNRSLVSFLLANKIEGEVHHPREPIYRADDTYLEPDMMYVSEELKRQMGKQRTSADIVFEYLSESSAVYDRTTKAATYLALGVRELWLIDPANITIEVRNSAQRKGKLIWEGRRYSQGEMAASQVLREWQVSVDELFDGLV
jgi:Uma2 family endonuclease